MMDIGLTRFATSNVHYWRRSFGSFLEAQQRMGISCIELWGGAPHYWFDHLYPGKDISMSGIHLDCDIALSAFAPQSYGYSLCAPLDSPLRKATLRYYENCIANAAESRIAILCLTPAGGCFDMPRSTLFDLFRDGLAELSVKAQALNVTIALGSAPPNESPILTTLSEVWRMHDEIDSPNLKIMLDTWPMSAAGESIPQWFKTCGAEILHMRFTDARNDGPRIWGEGCLPCSRYLEAVSDSDYKGVLCLRLPADRYDVDPEAADRRNLGVLRTAISAAVRV